MKNKLTYIACILLTVLLCLFVFAGCRKELTVDDGDNIVIAEKGFRSPFKIVIDENPSSALLSEVQLFRDAVYEKTGCNLEIVDSYEKQESLKHKLYFCAESYYECSSKLKNLADNEFCIYTGERAGVTFAAVAFGHNASRSATDCFIDQCAEGKLLLNKNKEIKGTAKIMDSIITTNVSLRDPCILVENGIYYMYGTGWKVYKNDTGDLSNDWTGGKVCVTVPEDASTNHWAPEVYKLEDPAGYFMFTTYFSDKTNHRGCAVFRSDDPEGPFELYSDGHITPTNWDAIDGHLYIDKHGDPWIVFIHEWTCTDDNVGRMSVARLSSDLKKTITTPKDVFMGTDAPWATGKITDGPWIYTLESGKLIMLWSNFDDAGYACGMAISESGNIKGPWKQLPSPLYSKFLGGKHDGGHGMIFRALDGRLYLSIHSPNTATEKDKTLAIFVPVREIGDRLVADIRYELND